MTSLHPTQVTVDLGAIRYNFCEVRKIVPKEQRILCVVKSNAYGHGLEAVATALSEEGADFFGVRDLDEGKMLRKCGIKVPILLLLGLIDEAFDELVQFQLIPVVYDLDRARAFNSYLEAKQLTHAIHIKVDTGMTRLGVPVDQVPRFMEEIQGLKQLKVEGVLSHLAEATDSHYTAKQKEAWDSVYRDLLSRGWEIPHWHFSNSIGAIRTLFPNNNMVRAGIILYGAYPDPSLRDEICVKPALRWTTEVIDLKSVPAETPVSYGCTFTTKRPSKIAALPVGYADGYPRLLSNRGEVLIRGQRAPIAGRVCMDLTMADVTDIPEVRIGDTVTLIGSDEKEQILADDVAEWSETISYEVLARISRRVPRRYNK